MYKNKYMIKHVTCDMNILNYIARIVVNSLPAKHDVYVFWLSYDRQNTNFHQKFFKWNVHVILFLHFASNR